MTFRDDATHEEMHDQKAQVDIILDAAWLIYQARDFYQKNQGQQIPHEVWDELCEQVDFDEHYERSAKIGQNSLEGLENTIIPAIAAISLGVSTEQLSETLEHHDVCAVFFPAMPFLQSSGRGL